MQKTDMAHWCFPEGQQMRQEGSAMPCPWRRKSSFPKQVLPFWSLWMKKKVEISAETCTNVFDYDKIEHTLFCRTRRQGDMIPLRRGRKKIKELFIDAKIPRAERERYPLFVAGDTVIWVPRLKEAFGAEEQTDRKVWIQIRRVQE